jgi:hypothetical protein
MENEFDILINANLELLGKSSTKSEYYTMFIDQNGDRVDFSEINPKIIAEEMEMNGLIKLNGENCILIRTGSEILNNGGWLKYINDSREDSKVKEELVFLREKMNDEITLLTLKSLKHEEKIRNQKGRIRDLEEQTKVINLLKLYWWVLGISIGIGVILSGVLF